MEAAQILDRVVARFIGTKHERDIKKLQPVIAAINAREAETQALTDEGLKTRRVEHLQTNKGREKRWRAKKKQIPHFVRDDSEKRLCG